MTGLGGFGPPPPPPPPWISYPQPGAAAWVGLPGLGMVKVAGVGQRFLARLIDSVLEGVLTIALAVVGLLRLLSSTRQTCDGFGNCDTSLSAGGLATFFGMFVAGAFASFLYELITTAVRGQTLGKFALGIKVVRADTGRPLVFGKAFLRQLIPWAASAACFVAGLLVYVSVFFDSSGANRSWYDRAAEDYVISVR